jgi:hypothetical protein
LAIPQAVELSIWTGVGGCGYPISSSVICRIVAHFVFSNIALISTYDADERMAFIICVVANIDPLCVSSLVSFFHVIVTGSVAEVL